MTKQHTLDNLMALERDIQKLASAHSLATLEHKLNMRQQALELLFERFMTELTPQDLALLKEIQLKSQEMMQAMQATKHEKSDEIIKYKNKGRRIRLYSDIAQQK